MALQQRYCQLNPRGRVSILTFDLDHKRGPLALDAPPPTFATLNPKTGHQHAHYLLASPVSYGAKAHKGPQKLLEDVYSTLARELGADTAYNRLLTRGPYHPEHHTRLIAPRVYTLLELLEDLPPIAAPSMTHREAVQAGNMADSEGRNLAAFDALRRVAYSLKRKGVTGEQLRAQVQEHADLLNRDTLAQHVSGPLPRRELLGIVKSVCRWTDEKYTPKSTRSPRAAVHSRDRGGALSDAQQLDHRQQGQAQGAITKREATRQALRLAKAKLEAQGSPVTWQSIQIVTGLSKFAIYAHPDIWQA